MYYMTSCNVFCQSNEPVLQLNAVQSWCVWVLAARRLPRNAKSCIALLHWCLSCLKTKTMSCNHVFPAVVSKLVTCCDFCVKVVRIERHDDWLWHVRGLCHFIVLTGNDCQNVLNKQRRTCQFWYQDLVTRSRDNDMQVATYPVLSSNPPVFHDLIQCQLSSFYKAHGEQH